MKFRQETIRDFNLYYDTTLVGGMAFSEVVENIDDANNNYFYISMCENDVIEAFYNEKEIAQHLELDSVYIKELSVYVLLHA